MAYVWFCAISGLVIAVIRLYTRVRDLERTVAALKLESPTEAEVAEVPRRVRWTEDRKAEPPAEAPAEKETAARWEPPPVTSIAEAQPAQSAEASPAVYASAPAIAPRAPKPAFGERVRGFFSDDEWETLVGGSVLNKAGAVVLVIGIALFLAYSWTHMTAAGRAFLSFGLSLVLLGAGIWIERRARYRTFARGLIGAGWAGLYATTYAIWAVPAAQILPDPFAGSLALLVVAGGIIAHSMFYQSQSATGVAYASAFAALAATPSSPFAIAALIPLGASLLFIAARFEWYSLALGGLAASWGVLLFKHEAGASLLTFQAVIAAYWLLFEAFDLLRVRRRARGGGVEWIYPLNLAALGGMSYMNWAPHYAHRLWIGCAAGAGLFLVDSIVRGWMLPPLTIRDEPLSDRLAKGGFESSALVSAVLAGLAISVRAPGMIAVAGLAIEAEAVYLLGMALGSRFLELLGGAGFVWSLVRILASPDAYGERVVLGHAIRNWSPVALLHAFLFYFNRALRVWLVFSYAAVALVFCVLMAEAPAGWVGMAWVIYGLALFEIALRGRAADFRRQAFALMFAGTLMAAFENGLAAHPHVIAVAVALAAMYGCALRLRGLEIPEQFELSWGSAGAVALLAAVLVWIAAPPGYAAAGICALSVALLELGVAGMPARLAHFGGPALFTGALFLLLDKGLPVKHPDTAEWVSYAVAAAAGLGAMARRFLRAPEQFTEKEGPFVRGLHGGIGTGAALIAIWAVTPEAAVTPLWVLLAVLLVEFGLAFEAQAPQFAGLGATLALTVRALDADIQRTPWSMLAAVVALYWLWGRFSDPVRRVLFWVAPAVLVLFIGRVAEAGSAAAVCSGMAVGMAAVDHRWRLRDAARQAYIIAGIAFVATFVTAPHILAVTIVAAAFFTAQRLTRATAGRVYYSALGTLLIMAKLFSEVSGGLLTVSWALESVALLGCGFALRERVLRVEGLALLFACILKVFLYDLRNLETVYRILSFIALGVILLAVSWIYTRFHEHVRRLL